MPEIVLGAKVCKLGRNAPSSLKFDRNGPWALDFGRKSQQWSLGIHKSQVWSLGEKVEEITRMVPELSRFDIISPWEFQKMENIKCGPCIIQAWQITPL